MQAESKIKIMNVCSCRNSDTILPRSFDLSIAVYNLGYDAITLMTMLYKNWLV